MKVATKEKESNTKARTLPFAIKVHPGAVVHHTIPSALVLAGAAAAARASTAAADAAREGLQRSVGVSHQHSVALKRCQMHGGPRRWRRRRRVDAVVLSVIAMVVVVRVAVRFGAD
jgi:hypothetical protein